MSSSARLNDSKIGLSNRPAVFALLPILLWMSSLFFVAYTGYSLTDAYPGFMVLLFGWVHEAWYANVLFFAAFVALAAAQSLAVALLGFALSALAVALSLTAFALLRAPEMIVYGFGLGAPIWLAAIQLMFIAAGAKLAEFARPDSEIPGRVLALAIPIVVFLVLTGGFATLATMQRLSATGEDLALLQGSTVLKLSPICKEGLELRNVPWQDGPVELEENVHGYYAQHSLPNLTRLHAAGVTVSRHRGMDIQSTDDAGLLYSMRPAQGPPSVLVRINDTPLPADTDRSFDLFGHDSGVRVSITGSGGISRSGSWVHERGPAYCPPLRRRGSGMSTIEEFVVEVLRRERPKLAVALGEADIKQSQMLEISIRERRTPQSHGVLVDDSCAGKLSLEPPGADSSEIKQIATRYRLWGPLRLPQSDLRVLFDLGKFGFSHLTIACSANRFVLLGLQPTIGRVHAIHVSPKGMTIAKWVHFGLPAIGREYKPTWLFGKVALEGNNVRVDLRNEVQGRRAVFLVEL